MLLEVNARILLCVLKGVFRVNEQRKNARTNCAQQIASIQYNKNEIEWDF